MTLLHFTLAAQAQDNDVADFESVADALESWHHLSEFDLSKNPVAGVPKYRDKVIVMSRGIGECSR